MKANVTKPAKPSRFSYVKYDDKSVAIQNGLREKVEAIEAVVGEGTSRLSTTQRVDMHKAISELENALAKLPQGRSKDLALKKCADMIVLYDRVGDFGVKETFLQVLEETYMWVGKAVRDGQIARNGSAPEQEERCDDGKVAKPEPTPEQVAEMKAKLEAMDKANKAAKPVEPAKALT